MVTIESYPVAVALCVVTMLCWGSWANTQKLVPRSWPFQLFYWDYSLGVLLITLVLAVSMGSMGDGGRVFSADLQQASGRAIGFAMFGGVVFNIANILLVAAIEIAGMAVAFPVGIGLALVLGVLSTYLVDPSGNPTVLIVGVACVVVAILLDAVAYSRLTAATDHTPRKGIVLAVLCGVLMGQFFQFVARAMPASLEAINEPENAGLLTPYTALVFFSLGLLLSNFAFNTFAMRRPLVGDPVKYKDYFSRGDFKTHLVGVLGGMIWGTGMSLAILSGDTAGYAISYGLGQGATMVAAFWGVFIWREFKGSAAGTQRILALMFVFFIAGLAMIVYANARTDTPPSGAQPVAEGSEL